MTRYCQFTTTGGGEMALQTAAVPRFVEDIKVYPVKFVGQRSTIFEFCLTVTSIGSVTVPE